MMDPRSSPERGASRPKVLVVGATGLLGQPVARRLREDGYEVRVLVREIDRARRRLGEGFEYVLGSVSDETAVDRAVQGCDAVHVSLGAAGGEETDEVEHRGTASVAAAAARHGLRRISYLTGSLVREDYGELIPEHRAKLAAERAIEASGVAYTFFRPTYFMDNLPRHVHGHVAVLLGRQKRLLRPVAARDFAALVARALRTPAAANRELYVHGPEPITLAEALHLYCALVASGSRVITVPRPVMSLVDRIAMGGRLRASLEIMALLARLGERGDAGPTTALLGAPTTTVRAWCEARAAERGALR
jgi:uncharacterized protein YbjT (DUF2867 family)